jgi:diguanylate cyclase (GGDEF)-like protein/PAS domain S-box-containing protein
VERVDARGAEASDEGTFVAPTGATAAEVGPRKPWRARAADFLPRGGGLDAAAWAARHRAIVALLWLHVPALVAVGLAAGVAPLHVAAETSVLAVAALVAGYAGLSRTARMASASLGLVTASAVLVHFSGGYVEMHFHFFVVVVVVSLYQHWVPFLLTIAYVAVHHGILGVFHAESVFNHPDALAHPWKWAGIHAGFILAESVAAVYAWRHAEAAQTQASDAARHLVAEQARLEERTAALSLMQNVASAANQASSVDEAIGVALAAVCSYTGWPVGHAYLVAADASAELVDTGIWHGRRSDAVEAFQRASQEARMVAGLGLPGRVVARKRAISISDLAADDNFTRKAAAARAGLVSAFAFPVLVGSEVAGVLEFFADRHQVVGDELLELMDHVGTQLGRVIERRRASESVRSSEERIRSILETASDAFVGMDEAGLVTEWNRRAETMFGWTSSEALGRPVGELVVPPQHREAHRAGLQRFLATGDDPVLGRRVELSAMHRDGAEFPVELTVWSTASGDETNFNAFIQDISERARSQAELERAYEKVSQAASALERRNREVTLISEMGDLLQSCEAVDEAYEIIARYAGQLFAGYTGAVYVLAASGNMAEAVASWGGALGHDEDVFAPSACWGLRRGRPHEVGPGSGLACAHAAGGTAGTTLCIPMVAQSEALGMLHLRGGDGDGTSDSGADRRQLAVAVAEHLALALANFRLRATLRTQSIRDPLTGLYNRRYLEESLDRELRRADRSGRPLSVVSIDVDHFKRFNDTFGHSAGDAVLAAVGRVVLEHVRGEDIACRMGGEELVVILPDCSGESAVARAEELRTVVRNLAVEFQGEALGRVTVSLGVATFPTHGTTTEDLMVAADAALYRAKAQGRDRTLVHAP